MTQLKHCALWMLVLAHAAGAATLDATLRYKSRSSALLTGPVKTRTLEAKDAPDPPLKGQPECKSDAPLFFTLTLGPNEAPCALLLDESRGTGAGYDHLYVDTDGDGDLADEQPICGQTIAGDLRGAFLFMRARATIDYAGHKAPWHFDAYTQRVRATEVEPERTVLAVRPRGYYHGALTLDGKERKVVLVDTDCTGRFNDPPTKDAGDRLLIDANGDERFDRATELFTCAKYLTLDGSCYQLTVAPSGETFRLEPTKVAMGQLARHGGGTFTLALLSPEHGEVKASGKDGAPAKAPVGKYTIQQSMLELKTEGGGTWKATSRAVPDEAPVEVAAEGVAQVKFGPPLRLGSTVKVTPEGTLDAVKPGDTLVMVPKITGQAGEAYDLGALGDRKSRPRLPTVIIRNAKGEVVTQGDFRYG